METSTSIEYLMLKSHERLHAMLDEIENGVGLTDQERVAKVSKFIEEIEKHFTIEEQAIYSFTHLGDDAGQKLIRELLAHHSQLRAIIPAMRTALSLRNGRAPEEFTAIISAHQRLEGEGLYQKLDHDLKDDEKEFILRKIEKLNI